MKNPNPPIRFEPLNLKIYGVPGARFMRVGRFGCQKFASPPPIAPMAASHWGSVTAKKARMRGALAVMVVISFRRRLITPTYDSTLAKFVDRIAGWPANCRW
jgi:hypothetical protein